MRLINELLYNKHCAIRNMKKFTANKEILILSISYKVNMGLQYDKRNVNQISR